MNIPAAGSSRLCCASEKCPENAMFFGGISAVRRRWMTENRPFSSAQPHPAPHCHKIAAPRLSECSELFTIVSTLGGWCNGSTADSESVCLGSNPSPPVFRPILTRCDSTGQNGTILAVCMGFLIVLVRTRWDCQRRVLSRRGRQEVTKIIVPRQAEVLRWRPGGATAFARALVRNSA